MISGPWSLEEEDILKRHFRKTRTEIQRILRDYDFERSLKSIERKKDRLKLRMKSPIVGNHENSVMEGQFIKGVSTSYDGDGNVKQQWVKTDTEKTDLLDKIKEAVDGIIEPCTNQSQEIKTPINDIDDLLVVYPIADAHLGMMSWHEETGNDYDLKICEKIINDSMEELVDSAPSSKECLIANLADFFHTDSTENKTMRSGHILDVDGRWGKIIQIGVRAYRNVINLALEKHEKVTVKSGVGNHDDHSSMWLAMMMKAYFENNPRVEIELPLGSFSYHKFGKNLIGITHGGIKLDRLPGLMATDMPSEWGNTIYRTFWTGHIHHKEVKEFPGCIVEAFRAITAKDAWTYSSGYRATRTMECVIFDKAGGEHGRRLVNIK